MKKSIGYHIACIKDLVDDDLENYPNSHKDIQLKAEQIENFAKWFHEKVVKLYNEEL